MTFFRPVLTGGSVSASIVPGPGPSKPTAKIYLNKKMSANSEKPRGRSPLGTVKLTRLLVRQVQHRAKTRKTNQNCLKMIYIQF